MKQPACADAEKPLKTGSTRVLLISWGEGSTEPEKVLQKVFVREPCTPDETLHPPGLLYEAITLVRSFSGKICVT